MNTKKCIVLDLDNTLWGGVLGEDGPNEISLGLEEDGAHYLAFQQALLDLWNQGVLLAIASKNNHDDAMQVIHSHPYMVLRDKHFAATRINWADKVQNLREIAKELNIGTDSFVFLDDDPINRGLVRVTLPEVEVPDLPKDPSHYAKFIMDMPYFKTKAITDEDTMRGNMYVTERLRMEAEKRVQSKDDFLRDLGMEVHWYEDDVSSLPRLAQMTGKTNQFNANKQSMTEEEIYLCMKNSEYGVFHIRAKDRFGDYGIIGLAIIKRNKDNWGVRSFLMSCRALYRGIEETFLFFIASRAKEEGKNMLVFDFQKTGKNKPAEDFLKRHCEGFHYLLYSILEMPEWVVLKKG